MVERIDNLFDALHKIIVSFFFKLAIFTPALVNAVLVGFGVGSFSYNKWGLWAGIIAGIITAVAIEAASIIASFNLDAKQISSYILPLLYIGGSWIVVWLGLREGWLIDVIGFVMPIFAISLPAVIAGKNRQREQRDNEFTTEKEKLTLIAQQQSERTRQEEERTKQERAKARAIKYQTGISTGNSKKNSTIPPVEEIMEMYGVQRSRAYEIRREMSTTTTQN